MLVMENNPKQLAMFYIILVLFITMLITSLQLYELQLEHQKTCPTAKIITDEKS
jgi:Ni,Fe-hydrogenase I cytochrome b subunit